MKRRVLREMAFKIIYAMDMGENTLETAMEIVLPNMISERNNIFIMKLVTGVFSNLEKIDDIIKKHSNEWDLDRMASTDRNIIRLAVFEILYCDDIPFSVSINEAVEIAKKYCSANSYKFINGLLGSISQDRI